MKYQYDSKGEVVTRPKIGGRKIERQPLEVLPCGECPKIPKGMEPSPRNAVEMTERSWQVYNHWTEAVAVGFTDEEQADAIVRQNASILREIDQERAKQPLYQLGPMMASMAAMSSMPAPEPKRRNRGDRA